MCFWRSFFLPATVILHSESPEQNTSAVAALSLQTSTACEDRLIMRIHCYTHWYTHRTHGVCLNMCYFMLAHPISSSWVHDWVSPFCRRAAPVLVVFFSCPHYSRPTLRLRSYTTVSDRLFDESNKPSVDALRTMRNTVSCASLNLQHTDKEYKHVLRLLPCLPSPFVKHIICATSFAEARTLLVDTT